MTNFLASTPWPADHVERHKVADLVPYARNSRKHSAQQIDQVAAAIKQWGWTTPVLVDEHRMIIAGHARVMAAQKLGIETIPVMVAIGWTKAQIQAYVIADNKLALNSTFDDEMLRVELGDLKEAGFDLGLTGFELPELDRMLLPTVNGGAEDLMDPTDGGGETHGASTVSLSWGKTNVPISEEEFALLDALLAKHTSEFGTQFGFVRETFG